jgi:PAS domain S-box-containing protein
MVLTRNQPDAGIARRDKGLVVAATLLAAATFTFDLLMPLGVAGGAPYAVLVLLGLWSRRPSIVLVLAGAATILTILGGLLSPPGEELWKAVLNRTLTILAAWAIAILLYSYRRTQAALAKSQEERQAYLDIVQVALVVLDRDGNVRLLNRKGCEVLGYDEGEADGLNWFETFSPQREAKQIEKVHRQLVAGEIEPVEYFENAVRTRDGRERIMAWHNTVLRDDRGRITGTLSAGEDITERLAAENAAREQAALARIGQMAAVVAHEVRNPVAGIRGSIQVLAGRLAGGAEEKEVVDNLLERLDSMAGMCQDLLSYSRPRRPRLEPLSLKEILHATAHLLASDPGMQRVEVDITGHEGELKADPELLTNMFLNLLLNAAQAMKGEGVIRVGIVDGDGQWHVSVEDTGPGIPEELSAQIFDPFFTTRTRGTGLGLAIAKQCAEAHQGTIALSRSDESGTRFQVSLPRERGV